MNLYIGCPIWSFKGWIGNFYPKGTKPADFLHEYGQRLTSVEGNTTFYAVPAQKTVETWAESLPETFRFCPKVPKVISHEGRLVDNIERAREFIKMMSPLGTRLGPMFLQLPPRYTPKLLADLQAFLAAWPREIRLAVEVRHLDWFESPEREALNRLLSEYNMARVVIDTRPIRSLDGDKILEGSVYQTLLAARARKPNVPILPERTADFIFLRYIGHPQMEQNESFLEDWAGYVSSQLSAGADAYVFCHSPENLTAPYLCRDFHRRVAEKVIISPLPWDKVDARNFEQGQLF
jgi:uncharacterized protein YecE (DUF72 family)